MDITELVFAELFQELSSPEIKFVFRFNYLM